MMKSNKTSIHLIRVVKTLSLLYNLHKMPVFTDIIGIDAPIWRLFLNHESISRLIMRFPKAYDIDFNPFSPLDYYSWYNYNASLALNAKNIFLG